MQQISDYRARKKANDSKSNSNASSDVLLNSERRRKLSVLLVRVHLGWIIFDCVMSIVILLTDLLYGDYKANFIKTVSLLRNFNNFLTVVIFLGVWNGITLCFTWKSGNEPYDFLICACCKNVIGAFF